MNCAGWTIGRPASTSQRLAPRARASSASSSERNSTRIAAASSGASFHSGGIETNAWATFIESTIISSVALAPASTSGRTHATASSIVGKITNAVVAWRPNGTVSNTASETNPSVPSDPTSSRLKISSGSSASRNAHQPVTGRVLDLELSPDALGQLRVGADLVADLAPAPAPAPARAPQTPAAAPGAAVSIVVPDGSTNVSERTVW